jgi:hypothetical protein
MMPDTADNSHARTEISQDMREIDGYLRGLEDLPSPVVGGSVFNEAVFGWQPSSRNR